MKQQNNNFLSEYTTKWLSVLELPHTFVGDFFEVLNFKVTVNNQEERIDSVSSIEDITKFMYIQTMKKQYPHKTYSEIYYEIII